jgi:agmatinase
LPSTSPRFALLGLPWDASSSFLRGAAAAPPRIREALWSPSANSSTELGIAIEPASLHDVGDLDLPEADPATARDRIRDAVRRLVADGYVPFSLGGDHSVTYPVVCGLEPHGSFTILHVDAHGDLYDEFPLPSPDEPSGRGDRYSHACPFARLMEEGRCTRLVQVGIRTMTPHLRAQAARFGVEVFGPDDCARVPVESLQAPLYVSLDLDGLDPAFVPGVAHPEPGGLTVRDVVGLLHRVRVPIAGGDVVEYNPPLDVRDLTARVAAKLLKELLAVATRNAA